MKTIILAIPSLNEETVLRDTVEKTLAFVSEKMPNDNFRIVIVDNGSSDRTQEIGRALAAEHPDQVIYQRLEQRGKGLAVRDAWTKHEGDIYAFMDADLATDLKSLPPLINYCPDNGMAIGSRYLPESEVKKSITRRIFSWGYRLTLKTVLETKIHDLPCGFKAASAKVVRDVFPDVKNNAWFFDTELTIRAEKKGLPIVEVPVKWHEVNQADRPSRVSLSKVAREYLERSWALRRELFRKR